MNSIDALSVNFIKFFADNARIEQKIYSHVILFLRVLRLWNLYKANLWNNKLNPVAIGLL